MTDPVMIYSGLMRLQIDRLNSVAQNTSNVNSVGYLQETNHIDPKQFVALLQGKNIGSGFVTTRNSTIGSLNVTNIDSNLALASDHWFLINKDGQNAVTRNGKFTISKEGSLMLGDYYVMGENGKVQNLTSDFRVNADGTIFINDQYVDKLKLVSASLNQDVTSKGNGIYEVAQYTTDVQSPKVVQGALNNSNVNLESDMTRMIEITRHIESVQRAISAYDDMLDVGINQLGK